MSTSGEQTRNFRQWLAFFGSPRVLMYALPWLMVLLIAGTVAQKDLGLYAAHKIYFSSWILWMGPFPLPGAYITLGLITTCLFIKFLMFSPWRKANAGIILSHLGVLVLLIGGMVTALSQKEGFIAIGEGQEQNAVSDYHARVLSIHKDGRIFALLAFNDLKEGNLATALPFKARIESLCTNCRPAPVKNARGRKGLAEQISLRETLAEKEAETNLSGVTLRIEGAEDSDGVYVVMEEIPHAPEIKSQGSIYKFSMGRAHTTLPFSIVLNDFAREVYPGTDMASGFSSDITIRDGETEWPYMISMNEPLRYKGYTFYQSSFSLRPDGEYSVLSVVKNKGRAFPYLASLLIFAGLLLHVVLRSRKAA